MSLQDKSLKSAGDQVGDPGKQDQSKFKHFLPAQLALQAKVNGSSQVGRLQTLQLKILQAQNAQLAFNGQVIQQKSNNSGLPNKLKAGVESLAGIDMSDVQVHYNSTQPAQLNAHAFAQGNQIHLGHGQEGHLPHEAWHVVQQKQGRVQATTQMKLSGIPVNDDASLEQEADVMGAKAMQFHGHSNGTRSEKGSGRAVVQRKVNDINPGQFTEGPGIAEATDLASKISGYNQIDGQKESEKELSQLNTQYSTLGTIENETGPAKQKVIDELNLKLEAARSAKDGAHTKVNRIESRASLEERKRLLENNINEFKFRKDQLAKAPGIDPAERGKLSNKIDTDKNEAPAQIASIEGEIQEINLKLGIGTHDLSTAQQDVILKTDSESALKIKKQKTNREEGEIDDSVDHEKNAVDVQIENRKLITGDNLHDNVSDSVKEKVNKYKAVAEGEYGTKFSALVELEDKIENWLSQYTTDGFKLKDKYASDPNIPGQRDQHIRLYSQLNATRQELLKEVFRKDGGGQVAGSGYSPPGFEAQTSSQKVSERTGLVKDALATGGGLSSDLASAKSMDGSKGFELFQHGFDQQAKVNVKIGPLSPQYASIVGAGLGTAADIAGLVKFIADWKGLSTTERTIGFFEQAASAANVLKSTATIAKAVNTLKGHTYKSVDTTGKAKDSVKSIGDLSPMERFLTLAPIISDGVNTMKNSAQVIIAIYNMSKKRSGKARLELAAGGTISLISAVKSAMGATKAVYDLIGSAPANLVSAIPILGLALDVANVIFAIYKSIMAGKSESAVKEMAKEKEMQSLSTHNFWGKDEDKVDAGKMATRLSQIDGSNPLNAGEIGKVSQVESRGVLGFGGVPGLSAIGAKQYLRFNQYVLTKIDQHVKSSTSGMNLTIHLSTGGETLVLTPKQIAFIREYEYISKMQEINQKRKVKGTSESVAALANMGASIATLSGVGAAIGAGLKGGIAASRLTHSAAKAGQKMYRNSKRADYERAWGTGDVSTLGSVEAYQTGLGNTLGKENSNVDKSATQKSTEYGRHAIYIMEHIANMPIDLAGTGEEVAKQSKTNFSNSKKLLNSTGMDFEDFLSADSISTKYSALVSAMKGGR